MATILIVEDELTIAQLVSDLLSDVGYHVVIASDGYEALKMLDQQPIDCILTDLMMPRMNGIQLGEALQSHAVHHRIPLILMTAVPEKVARLGVHYAAVLTKPFHIEELLQTVARFAG
ncbi:MAG: response regulator transcription factor [Herpetosiphon sp.]